MHLLLLCAFALLPPQSTRTLRSYRETTRPLLIFAPIAKDPRLRQQLALLAPFAPGLRERQLVLLTLVPDGSDALLGREEQARARQTYAITPDSFVVLLLGKDGGEKQRWTAPVAFPVLRDLIDSMPMRQDEMKHSQQKE